jgi:hypothetical protein
LDGLIFNLSRWNVSKIVSKNGRSQPLKANLKKYEKIMFEKLSFEIPHHLVEFPVWDFPVQH